MRILTLMLLMLSTCCAVTAHAGTSQIKMALCVSCHGANGEGNQAMLAPRLAGQNAIYLSRQLTAFKTGLRGYHPEDKSGAQMRAIAQQLSESDIVQLAGQFSQIRLHKIVNNISDAGKDKYNATCGYCHGQHAEGYVQLQSANLNILGDWYIAAQMNSYIKGWRGTAEGSDPPDLMMRSIATHISSAQDMAQVIRYIGNLASADQP